jgi:hypothetical protein
MYPYQIVIVQVRQGLFKVKFNSLLAGDNRCSIVCLVSYKFNIIFWLIIGLVEELNATQAIDLNDCIAYSILHSVEKCLLTRWRTMLLTIYYLPNLFFFL